MHSEVIQARLLKPGCTSVNFKDGLEGTVRFADTVKKGMFAKLCDAQECASVCVRCQRSA